MNAESTKHRKPVSGRGGSSLGASALGLALATTGFVASARADSDDASTPVTGPSSTSSTASDPFVTAPAVRLGPVASPAEVRRPTADTAAGVPVRLVAPRLDIDVPVIPIDAPSGVLRPPDDPQMLGWWRDGAEAGAAGGSALVTGHTVSSGGGAFDDLESLEPGDRVRVRTPQGAVRYRVTETVIYRKASLARHAEDVFSQKVPGRLVLVTCEDWNGSVYLSNAVVFAEPMPDRG